MLTNSHLPSGLNTAPAHSLCFKLLVKLSPEGRVKVPNAPSLKSGSVRLVVSRSDDACQDYAAAGAAAPDIRLPHSTLSASTGFSDAARRAGK